MKVFITADIEGTAFTTYWEETEKDRNTYARAAAEMTREVRAAIDGAMAAGADFILVNDAHDFGINLDPNAMPECVELIRGWSSHPFSMVEGIDGSFDAAMFVGWHSCAGRRGNPLSHTMSGKPAFISLNGIPCSEFLLYSWAAASVGVPSVLLCGDRNLTVESAGLHPALRTVWVKDGLGGMTRCKSPARVEKEIRAAAEEALRQDLSHACITLPEHFTFRITYKEVKQAVKVSYYPGMRLLSDDTVEMETDSYLDVLTACKFVL